MIGAELHRPYDRPPLSKKLLSGDWGPERIQLRQPDSFDELDVDWRFGTSATALRLSDGTSGGTLALSDGSELDADGIIIATGATARQLPGQVGMGHVHALRTLDDAMTLRREFGRRNKRVVVIGAGFIGLEAAAVARQLGNEVIVVDSAPAPLMRGLGEQMGAMVGEAHRANGVDIRCDEIVESLTPDGVQLVSGHLDADIVLVGIGATPAVGWIEGSGLALDDGIVCTETLLAAPGVYAAGDVARWPNQLFGETMRIEHWTNAAEQGAAAANNLLDVAAGADPQPYAPVPFFWSDQFDQRIQFLGRAASDDDVVVAAGSAAEGKLLALYGRRGRLRAAFGFNAPRWVMPMRQLLLDQASMDEALEKAAGLS